MRARAALAILAGLALTIPAAVVAPPASAAATVVVAPASAARDASEQARSLRRDVAALLQQYIDDYGDRFTEAERRQLLAYRADADRHLAAVVVTTRRLDVLTTQGASSSARRTAAAAAQSAWRRAKAAADTSFASARRIMEPKLSLLERVRALGDYNTMMDRFDALGATIDVAAAEARTP